MNTELKERNAEIFELRAKGNTYSSIGKKFGISSVRARQIYKNEWWRIFEEIKSEQ